MKLICFAHAGGFSSYFNFITPEAFEYVDDVILYEYPGRGSRFHERAFTNLNQASEVIAKEVYEMLQGEKFAVMGYSMGAFVAYEAALKMQEKYKVSPEILLVTSQVPPEEYQHIEEDYSDDKALTDYLISMGGIDVKLAENKEVFSYFLKTIRSDFDMLDTYEPTIDERKLPSLAVMYGKADQMIKTETIELWRNHTDRYLGTKVFEGGHFFVETYRQKYLEWMNWYITLAAEREEEE